MRSKIPFQVTRLALAGLSILFITGCQSTGYAEKPSSSQDFKNSDVHFIPNRTLAFHGTKPADMDLLMYTLLVTRSEECQRRSIGSGSGRTTSQNKSVKAKPWVSDDGTQFRFEIAVPTEIDHSYRGKCKYYVRDVVLTYQFGYMTSNKALFRFKGDSPFNPHAIEYGQKYYDFPEQAITTTCGRRVIDTPRKVEMLSYVYSCSTSPRLGIFMDFDTIPDNAEIELNLVKGKYYQVDRCKYPPSLRELIIDGIWVDDFNSPIPVSPVTGLICPDLTKEMIIEQHEAYLTEQERI